MKVLLCSLFLMSAICIVKPNGLLTDSMKKGIRKIGEGCQRSVGATLDEMNQIRFGPPYKGKTACAVACILDKAGVMADKKYSKKGFLTAVTPFMLADLRKISRMKEIANSCEKEAASGEDECDAANYIIECLRKNIPQITDFEF